VSPNIPQAVRHLITQYRRFLRTSYRFLDPHLREQFEGHLDRADVIVKGPYVTLARDLALGETLATLVERGELDRELLRLHWAFGDGPLFRHQQRALEAGRVGRSFVVTTGTGSGKTEAFLLPVLDGILRRKREGVRGVQAVLLYPMNALANDQLERLRRMTRGTGTSLSFALYTGDSETASARLREEPAETERVSRAQIRRDPPDLLLTNYKQLEFLLVRHDDRDLFTPALRFLVLDELHSYRGALATEIACLIRRIKAHASLAPGQLLGIGTSATVASGHRGADLLARFATALFGEELKPGDILGEAYAPPAPNRTTWIPRPPGLAEEELYRLDPSVDAAVVGLAERLTGRHCQTAGTVAERVGSVLEGNGIVAAIEQACERPRSLDEVALSVRERFSDRQSLSLPEVRREVEAYLMAGSVGTEDDPPRLRPKLHVFFHGVYDVGLCLNPECRSLVPHGGAQCPRCGAAARPAALCRTCGQDFVKVRFEGDDESQAVGTGDFYSGTRTAFLTHKLHDLPHEGEDEDEATTSGEETSAPRSRRTEARETPETLVPVKVCSGCGRLGGGAEVCPACGGRTVEMLIHKGPLHTCPACGDRYTRGDIVTPLRTGTASTASVVATHHLDLLRADDRKLLMFADNRQDVAHQAGYTADKHRAFVLRHVIATQVRDAGGNGVYIEELVQRTFDSYQAQGIIKRNPSRPEREQWLLALRYEIAMEVTQYARLRASLENLGLMAVDYEGLGGLAQRDDFRDAAAQAGLEDAVALNLVRAVLDTIRRSRAVGFDFFQEYVDPNRQGKYRLLEEEPYNVRFPEHCRKPQGYAVDRPEHIRKSARLIGVFQENPRAGQLTALQRLVARVVPGRGNAEAFLRRIVAILLHEDVGLLVTVRNFPIPERERTPGLRALQLEPGRIFLRAPAEGFRCNACQTWRPYTLPTCATPRCSQGSLHPEQVERENYYVSLYSERTPQRLRVAEHSAQISGEDRADRETAFKEGRIDMLVCTPTLELGVDIGPLLTVALRGAPPTPANYVQRVGRAGRRMRIGFASTFCAGSAHDRHAFEVPDWLVAGEFEPPMLRLENPYIVHRHLRSFLLENLSSRLPQILGDLLDDPQHPTAWDRERLRPLFDEVKAKQDVLTSRLAMVMARDREQGRVRRFDDAECGEVAAGFERELLRVLGDWWQRVEQVEHEFGEFSRVGASRDDMKKAAARQRAFRELTTDRDRAYVLNYLATHGVLPAYQFPIDTFSLDPGVVDTPTIYRAAAIAIEEFAPGNFVYANGHKLRSIRVLYAGGPGRGAGSQGRSSAESSGRLARLHRCAGCDEVVDAARNSCPRCGDPLASGVEAVYVDAFEAEESLRISSDEESRQRERFERLESLLAPSQQGALLYEYPFAPAEYQSLATVLVSNWGRTDSKSGEGQKFWLCPECGRHLPYDPMSPPMTDKVKRWQEGHTRLCQGTPVPLVLAYRLQTDCLVLNVPSASDATKVGATRLSPLLATLAEALQVGAGELLELEPGEIRSFLRPATKDRLADQIVFYETVPGGAGYVAEMARRLPEVAEAARGRLYGHDCKKACYLCLKHYRNQGWHASFDKDRVRDTLLLLSQQAAIAATRCAPGDGVSVLDRMLLTRAAEAATGGAVDPKTGRYRKGPIEEPLAAALAAIPGLPPADRELELRDPASGTLITVPDFAWESAKVAVFCDGFAVHGNRDTLELDARKRNWLQAHGWAVLTFWGRTILKDPARCAREVADLHSSRAFAQ